MEKPPKAKSLFLKFLPKAVSAVTFQNHPFSPDKKRSEAHKAHIGRGYSGQIVSIIPAEARRKPKNSSFETQDPTSPKISCMGQIKHKKKLKKEQRASRPRDFKPELKKTSTFGNMFRNKKVNPPGRRSGADKPMGPDRAPRLDQMRQFASGRDSLSNFDWSVQVAPVDADHRNYYTDEDSSEDEEREAIVPFSAPIMVGGGESLEPRREINLWKRRTMAQPRPLQVNTMVRPS
ncbi:hypothetical protein Acr_21g0010840 [Actinidia rufa]|uniref:Syringolide-induced protein 14-1-1 n=1 Tax=Actinidia rufa TaxID=165716 RepID=A0A7J0GI74_9ERIC|nr:hypothetical protein Acr_21g0010840 [Actinidia rufa]